MAMGEPKLPAGFNDVDPWPRMDGAALTYFDRDDILPPGGNLNVPYNSGGNWAGGPWWYWPTVVTAPYYVHSDPALTQELAALREELAGLREELAKKRKKKGV